MLPWFKNIFRLYYSIEGNHLIPIKVQTNREASRSIR